MRIFSLILLLIGLVIVVAAALAQDGLAVFTDQANVTSNTFTSTACFSTADTGFLDASAEVVDSGDGFELNPTNAFSDGTGFATNADGPNDRHQYYNYGISVPGGSCITGIEVRLDWWLDSTLGANEIRVGLSWDGGITFTANKTDQTETTSEHTVVLGSRGDMWGHAWTEAELSDANFRVKVRANGEDFRDYFLDWVPVKIYYRP